MTAFRPTPTTATDRESGVACPHCPQEIVRGESIVHCPRCGTVHHWACWSMEQGCGSYDCRPARVATSTNEEVLLITDFDLQVAKPLRAPMSSEEFAKIASLAEDTSHLPRNKLAIAAFLMALLGLPLIGLAFGFIGLNSAVIGMITGILAVVLGCIALALHRSSTHRGAAWAVSGILLGIGSFVGAFVLMFAMGGQMPINLAIDEIDMDSGELVDMPDHISRAMKANVFIKVEEKWKGLFGQGIGSGVILRIADQQALIVTNRHVVDPKFADGQNAASDAIPEGVDLKVKLVGQPLVAGKIEWIAPHGIDMALITVPVISTDPASVPWESEPHLRVGDRVFAIGNPHGLGWTHTSGEVSQVRKQDYGTSEVKVLQTTAAINPGNSGGGLYDNSGRLIGINTWIHDKRVAEGLNFALSFQPLLTMAPAKFNLPADHTP